MNNINNFSNQSSRRELPTNSLKDYLLLFRRNFLTIFLFTFIAIIGASIYAYTAPDIYIANALLKVSKPKGSILDNQDFGVSDFQSNRYISNEILVMGNITIREQVAREIIDSFKVINQPDDFDMLLTEPSENNKKRELRHSQSIAGLLSKNVSITQKQGLDFIEILCESTSPREAALMTNTYASAYRKFNLIDNRQQVTSVKNFLYQQRQEKISDLASAEEEVRGYKLQKGAVKLDQQASTLIDKLTEFESKRNALKIEMSIFEDQLKNYKKELDRIDPSISEYFASMSSEPYIERIRDEIARIQAQKTIALANNKELRNNIPVIEKYDSQIEALTEELNSKYDEFKSVIYTSSPAEIKQLTNKIFETEVKYQSQKASFVQLNLVIKGYEGEFNQMPRRTLELARLEREKMSYEKLYLLIENKYQQALIDEQSISGNVLIMNKARIPRAPAKPNRMFIILASLMGGLFMGFSFVYVKNYFDRAVKNPEDLEEIGHNVLSWIPKVTTLGKKSTKSELIVTDNNFDISSEAFKTLRTRIQFSKLSKTTKMILITSSAPAEGKSFIAANMAASFALANKRTVLVDCDLRKPRVHKLFKSREGNGLTNYFFGKCSLEDIFKKTAVRNLEYIAAGTIPPNPSEIIGSTQMKSFLMDLREEYDYVIIDSPPILAVSDSEILSRVADASILVTKADATEIEWINKSVDLLENENNSFIGIIFNQYNYKKGNSSYYKYNSGYYTENSTTKSKKRK
ncbi:MAG: polysaccharide biosynthesis tyrosine autokinase [Melioribacteraceae bacterium]|nr:polysaccharide biosynthesis tyrosine autokinase [Melioribacteraceae bacterium]